MDVRPFYVEHLKRMKLQPSQAWHSSQFTEEFLADLGTLEAFTGFVGEEPMIIGGLMDFWPGRAMAWTFISEFAGPHMLAVTRAVKTFLEIKAPRRTELYVDEGFEPGYRWARMLGFNFEANLRAFKPDGGAQAMFSRIR